MLPVIYEGTLDNCHYLPFYVTADNQTFVYEKEIIEFICEGNQELYQEFFYKSPNFHLFESNVVGKKTFPLIAFINECVNIFDRYVEAEIEDKYASSEGLKHMSERVYPVVSAIAKIGAKVQFGQMETGETPATIFEREMTRLARE